MALKLEDGEAPSFLVTHDEAKQSSNPQPYIAPVATSSSLDEVTFILGDGRNTSDPTKGRRRSTVRDFHNNPLEPGTS